MWPVCRNGRAFARDPKGRGFESRPVCFQVTVLGKLLTRMYLWCGGCGLTSLRMLNKALIKRFQTFFILVTFLTFVVF